MDTFITNIRLFKEKDAMAYTGLGRTKFRRWAAEIGAVRRFGKAVRYDRRVIDKAIDSMTGVQ